MLWIDNEKMIGMNFNERLHFEKRFDMTLDQLPEERTHLANHLQQYIDRIRLFVETFPDHTDKVEQYRAEAHRLFDSLDHFEALARQAIEKRTYNSSILISNSE